VARRVPTRWTRNVRRPKPSTVSRRPAHGRGSSSGHPSIRVRRSRLEPSGIRANPHARLNCVRWLARPRHRGRKPARHYDRAPVGTTDTGMLLTPVRCKPDPPISTVQERPLSATPQTGSERNQADRVPPACPRRPAEGPVHAGRWSMARGPVSRWTDCSEKAPVDAEQRIGIAHRAIEIREKRRRGLSPCQCSIILCRSRRA